MSFLRHFKDKILDFSNILMRKKRNIIQEELSVDESDINVTNTEIQNIFNSKTHEIDLLWKKGFMKQSIDKTIELYDFLDMVGATQLRLQYCGPCPFE